jgi:hypothetical protein
MRGDVMIYGETRVYHINLKNGDHATVVAACPYTALEELQSFDLNIDLAGVRVGEVSANREIAITFGDEDDIEELYDTWLSLRKQLKPGFKIEIDEDNDSVVVAIAGVWAKAFEETAPHIISSCITG